MGLEPISEFQKTKNQSNLLYTLINVRILVNTIIPREKNLNFQWFRAPWIPPTFSAEPNTSTPERIPFQLTKVIPLYSSFPFSLDRNGRKKVAEQKDTLIDTNWKSFFGYSHRVDITLKTLINEKQNLIFFSASLWIHFTFKSLKAVKSIFFISKLIWIPFNFFSKYLFKKFFLSTGKTQFSI